MAMTTDEKKARRLEGMQQMTAVKRIHRSLVNGRPPASELKTPLAAIKAARTLHLELEKRMYADSLKPRPGDWGVGIAYISTDISVLGVTPMFAPDREDALMENLTGQIVLGLIFGIVDRETKDLDKRVVVGARPFLTTTQTEEWFRELLPVFGLELNLTD